MPDRVSEKTSDRMSDVNPWIFRLKTSGFTADRKSALWTPRRGSLLCDVMLRHCMECYAMSSYVTSCCVMLHYVVLLLCVLVFWVCMHARMTCVCVLFLPYPHHYTSILGASASGLQPQLQLD